MAANLESVAAERIQQALAMLRQRVPAEQKEALGRFAEPYLQGLDAEDVAEREVLDLFGAVLSLWQFAYTAAQNIKATLQFGKQLVGCHHFDAGRGQFNGQG